MVEPPPAACVIQMDEADTRPAENCAFKPLTSGQLLLATRRKPDMQALLNGENDDSEDLSGAAADRDDDDDNGRECFLSKFLAVSATLLVCCFIYFVVLQRWYLRGS